MKIICECGKTFTPLEFLWHLMRYLACHLILPWSDALLWSDKAPFVEVLLMRRRRTYQRPARRRSVIATEPQSPNCAVCGKIMIIRMRCKFGVVCAYCIEKASPQPPTQENAK